MCSTLEYANMRLKSRVPNKNNAATSIENNPITSSVRSAIAPSPAAPMTERTRRIAVNATVVTPPARIAPTMQPVRLLFGGWAGGW